VYPWTSSGVVPMSLERSGGVIVTSPGIVMGVEQGRAQVEVGGAESAEEHPASAMTDPTTMEARCMTRA
jgi:hypothetical protein